MGGVDHGESGAEEFQFLPKSRLAMRLTISRWGRGSGRCSARHESQKRLPRGGETSSRLRHSQLERLRFLEKENLKLKKFVADLSLDEAMLKDVATKFL